MIFKKKHIPFIFLASLIALSFNAVGLILENCDIVSFNNGNGYLPDDIDVFTGHNGTTVYLIPSNGDSWITLMEETAGYTVYDALVASDGHLYIATSNGILKRNSKYNNPFQFITSGDDATCTLITTDVTYRLKEQSGYIYYISGVKYYRFDLNLLLVSYYDECVNERQHNTLSTRDFSFYNDDIYLMAADFTADDYSGQGSLNIYKNGDIHYTIVGTYINRNFRSFLQVVDGEYLYYGFNGQRAYKSGYDWKYASYQKSGILYPNGTEYMTFPYRSYLLGNNWGNGYIGYKNPVAIFTDGVDSELISVEFKSLVPSSSSGSSGSDNPTNFGDSHEWTNDEIATSARKIVPPIFFMVLLFFFLFAIGGN